MIILKGCILVSHISVRLSLIQNRGHFRVVVIFKGAKELNERLWKPQLGLSVSSNLSKCQFRHFWTLWSSIFCQRSVVDTTEPNKSSKYCFSFIKVENVVPSQVIFSLSEHVRCCLPHKCSIFYS